MAPWRKRKKQKTSKEENTPISTIATLDFETTSFKDKHLVVGSPVYAPYPGIEPTQESYYWGRISRKRRIHKRGPFGYKVKFEDGDVLETEITSKYIHRLSEAIQRHLSGKLLLPFKPPAEYKPFVDAELQGKIPEGFFREENETSEIVNGMEGVEEDFEELEETVPEPPVPTREEEISWLHAKLIETCCGECPPCKAEDCRRCDSCMRPSKGFRCFHRFCVRIEERNKAQPSEFLPTGWKFYLNYEGRIDSYPHSKLCGLTILAANGLRYSSLESAVRHNTVSFHDMDVDYKSFYSNAGIILVEVDLEVLQQHVWNCWVSSPMNPGQVTTTGSDGRRERKKSTTQEYFDRLRRDRCRDCVMCFKDDCGVCFACKYNNESSTRYPWLCLRKMCRHIPVDIKKHPARGFPKGWDFYYKPNRHLPGSRPPGFEGLVVVSPAKKQYEKIEDAFEDCNLWPADDSDESFKPIADFCSHLGAKWREPCPDHLLAGRASWHEWIREDGMKACLSSEVANVEYDFTTGQEVFTLKCGDITRGLLNDSSSQVLNIPATIEVDSHVAWDGCVRADDMAGNPAIDTLELHAPLFLKCYTPDQYWCQQVEIGGGRQVPNLHMLFQGFRVTLKVKPSMIENAGLGVFISVKPVFMDGWELRLESGELLDLGIYAPFCDEDYVDGHSHLLKSILHSYKNESYCFSTRDSEYFDITGDSPGELHSIARQHVPPYVNEISKDMDRVPSVVARYDMEGALHYWLGHSQFEQGPLTIRADGVDREIFVDYGENYEVVRLREGFPRISMSEQERAAKLQQEETSYLEEVGTFTASELIRSLQVLRDLLSKIGTSTASAMPSIDRITAVSILLNGRAMDLHKEFQDLADSESHCENGMRSLDPEVLCRQCSEVVVSAFKAWTSQYEDLEEWKSVANQSTLFCEVVRTFRPHGVDSVNELSLEQIQAFTKSEFE
eukprot:Nitzschia sp. Nitz4//scaffold12_size214221//91187//94243//NITZ4_001500-RA/size214221-snap-gene-0.92-mRNA-1//1//CDS//3329535020//2540//frame0